VAAPHELGDGPAHRVPDGDEFVDAQLIGEGDDVVCAVLQAEGRVRAQTAPVPAVVGGKDPEVPAERIEGSEPVEGARGAETVQKEQRRRSSGSG
jgi:hypothetical protein